MLLTIPSISKGTQATISLSKVDLLALGPVAADAYFQDGTKIKHVLIEWNSDPGSQKEIVRFQFQDASPQGHFLVTEKAQDVFLLDQLILVDFDNGSLVLNRSTLDAALSGVGGVSGFDINMG